MRTFVVQYYNFSLTFFHNPADIYIDDIIISIISYYD